MIRATTRLAGTIPYEPDTIAIFDLPREGFITEIEFGIKLWRGSKARFEQLLANSIVSIQADGGINYPVFPSDQTVFWRVTRNRFRLRYHLGADPKDVFDPTVVIPAARYSVLQIKWEFLPHESIDALVNIYVVIHHVLLDKEEKEGRIKWGETVYWP